VTALIFSLAPEQAIVAMDTLVTNPEGTPIGYTSKVFPLMHLGGAMCVTGLSNLALDWLTTLHRFVARDIKQLDDFATPEIQKLWARYSSQVSTTSTVYHFGFSHEEERYVGFAYRSTNDFQSERLNYAMGIKPPIANPAIASLEDFVLTMRRQRESEEAKESGGRLYVGGEIQLVILENQGIRLETVYRFPDYDDMYDQMCEQFPVTF
jgi:hypothetical protein